MVAQEVCSCFSWVGGYESYFMNEVCPYLHINARTEGLVIGKLSDKHKFGNGGGILRFQIIAVKLGFLVVALKRVIRDTGMQLGMQVSRGIY